jgi:hypothetical protein
MQVNADNSELSNALEMATDKGVPNGYNLLHVFLQKLVPALMKKSSTLHGQNILITQ